MNGYQIIRNEAGVVDLSDWGRFALRGDGAQEVLDALVGANMMDLYDGSAINTLIVSESGGVAAVTWVVGLPDGYMLVCEPDDAEIVASLLADAVQGSAVAVEDMQHSHFAWTLAGPQAQAVAVSALGDAVHSIAFMGALEIETPRVLAVRLGFVGEYELHLFGPVADKGRVLDLVASAGAKPVDPSAYPTMMAEMRTLSRSRDIPAEASVFESGLQWMIDFRKDQFLGKQALEARRGDIQRKCVMALIDTDAAGTAGAPLHADGTLIGHVRNAYWSGTLGKAVALCYIDAELAWPGIEMTVNGSQATTIGAPAFLTKSVLSSFS